MNCNSCIKKLDCVIYNQFKDELSSDWSTENNFCNKYQGVMLGDSFDDLLDELASLRETNDELIEEKEELRNSIDTHNSTIRILKENIENKDNTISELEQFTRELCEFSIVIGHSIQQGIEFKCKCCGVTGSFDEVLETHKSDCIIFKAQNWLEENRNTKC